MKVIAVADIAPAPWKNGGGLTRELLRLPEGDDWRLRISVADIAADGPFSPFPGVSRWFAVLDGAGVRLAWPGRAPLELRPGDAPLRFAGADAPDCTLIDGPTRDLNVMTRGGSASLAPAQAGERAWPGEAGALGLFALRPLRLHAPGAAATTLPQFSLAWLDPADTASRAGWLEDAAAGGAHTGTSSAAALGWWIRVGAHEVA